MIHFWPVLLIWCTPILLELGCSLCIKHSRSWKSLFTTHSLLLFHTWRWFSYLTVMSKMFQRHCLSCNLNYKTMQSWFSHNKLFYTKTNFMIYKYFLLSIWLRHNKQNWSLQPVINWRHIQGVARLSADDHWTKAPAPSWRVSVIK